jgi:hypothetical protein
MVKKGPMVSRGTIFVLADTMKTAEAWAAAHKLRKDRWRYAVNAEVFDVWGPNDTYAYVAGLDRDGERFMTLMCEVNARDLPWCERDAYILERDEQGRVPRRGETQARIADEPPEPHSFVPGGGEHVGDLVTLPLCRDCGGVQSSGTHIDMNAWLRNRNPGGVL